MFNKEIKKLRKERKQRYEGIDYLLFTKSKDFDPREFLSALRDYKEPYIIQTKVKIYGN